MAKFYGPIGYSLTEETAPGVWMEKIIEHESIGDVVRNTGRWQNGEHLNDDITVNHTISIVADPFAFTNLYAMRYVKWMGTKWRITNIEVQAPRIILTIGGVYNAPEEDS